MNEIKHIRRKTIALVIDSLVGAGSYQEDVWHAVAAACKQNGTGILIFPGGVLGGNPFSENEHMKNLIYKLVRRECVDGVILTIGNIVHNASPGEYSRFAHSFGDLPVVNIGFALEKIPGIIPANENGMETIIEHLVGDHGYRRVAFIRGPEDHEDAIQRYRAYQTVLERHDIPFNPDLFYIGDFNDQSGARTVQTWLDE